MSGPLVQSTALVTANGVSSISFTLNGVTAGNALAATIALNSADSADYINPPSASWTAEHKETTGTHGSANFLIEESVAGGNTTVTFKTNKNVTLYATGEMHELTGLTASAIDTAAIGSSVGTGTSLTVTSAAALSQSSEFVFAVIANDGANTVTQSFAVSTGWTLQWHENDGTNYETGAAAYQQFSSGGTPSATFSGMQSDSAGYAAILVPLKLSGASGVSASASQTDGADTQTAAGTPLITTSAAQTDSADTQVASASIGTAISASAAQTDGADTQAATGTPLITSSAAQTDGADTQAANGTPLITSSATQTDSADTQAATGTPIITSSAAQTDGADTQAATGTPLITSSAAQTDGTDIQSAHAAPITGVAANAAQTDGADTQSATATPLIVASAGQVDPADIQVGTVYVAFINANLADLFACQQAAVSQHYTGSKPTPLNFQVFITSGSWTMPPNTTTVYVSATAAGGAPFGSAGQQVLKQQLKAVAGDVVSVTIGQTVAVSVNGAQQLFLNPGSAYGKFQAQSWGQNSYIQGFGNGADSGSGDPALAVILWS